MATTDTPFLEGHRYRVDELGDRTVISNQWRWTAVLAIAGLLLHVGWREYRDASRPEVVPYYIAISESLDVRVLGPAPDRFLMKDGVIEKDVRSFIKALRRVPTDKVLMGEDWDEKEGIYGRVTTKGRKLLTQRVAQHDPMQVKDVVQVEITRTLKKGARSMDVTWTERTYTPEMELKSPPVIYSGIFTWVEQAPRTLAEVYANPLGIWYDEWSFDRQ